MKETQKHHLVKPLCDVGALRGVISEALLSKHKAIHISSLLSSSSASSQASAQSVRIPISISLLQAISQLGSTENADTHIKEAEDIIRKANRIANKLQPDQVDALISHLVPQADAKTASEVTINWPGVIIKLHEIVSQTKNYEQLLRDIGRSNAPSPTPFGSNIPPKSPDRGAPKRLDSLVIQKEIASPRPRNSSTTSLLSDALSGSPPTTAASSVSIESSSIPLSAITGPPAISVSFSSYGFVETDPVILPDGSIFNSTSRPSSVASTPSSLANSLVKPSPLTQRRPSVHGLAVQDDPTNITPSSSFSRYSASPVPADWATAPQMASFANRRTSDPTIDFPVWRRPSIESQTSTPLSTSPPGPAYVGMPVLGDEITPRSDLIAAALHLSEQQQHVHRADNTAPQPGMSIPSRGAVVDSAPPSLSSSTSSLSTRPDKVEKKAAPVSIVVEAPVVSDTTVPSSSSFRPTAIKSLLSSATPNSPRVPEYASTLPFWLDFVLYWGTQDTTQVPTGIKIDASSVLITMGSFGRLDHYLRARIVNGIHATIYDRIENDDDESLAEVFAKWAIAKQMKSKPDPMIHKSIMDHFTCFCKEYSSRLWNKEKLDKFQSRIVSAYATVNAPPGSGEPEDVIMKRVMQHITEDLLYLIKVQHRPSFKLIEELLVGLLGHNQDAVRTDVVKLLNILYDGHSWQHQEPLPTVVRCVGDAFRIEFEHEAKEMILGPKTFYLVTVTPPYRHKGDKARATSDDNLPVSVLSMHRLHDFKIHGIAELHHFEQAGYFDWRIVELNTHGQFLPLRVPKKEGGMEIVQGRFIVHPAVREEIMHEVWVDLQGAVWDTYNGTIYKRGTFANIIDTLDEYCGDGITTLYIMGAIDHRPEDHPFCPIDRATPARNLGSEVGFANLITAANARGIKIVVDSTSKLSARGRHRKYNNNICMTMDDKGYAKPMVGTDSVEFEWPECTMMNYRKVSTWDLVVSEVAQWAARGANGVRLDGAHTWPLILRADLDELYRVDSDGEPHYTPSEILSGAVVLQKWDNEARNFGYWGTVPKSAKRDTPFYPNPLFIKLTRELWLNHPQFLFLAEVQWDRELPAIVSGLIPYSCALPTALNSVFAKGLNKDGGIFDLGGRATVRAFYDYYDMRSKTYPQNAILIYPSSTHHTPYPLAFYSHGTWATIDLLYLLPEIPMTYIGEHAGWVYSVDIYTNRVRKGPYTADQSHIRGHYNHRTAMRKSHPILHSGGMVPLLCNHANGWHDMVFGFARFLDNEIAIVAVNFGNTSADFYVDMSPLAKICTSDDVIYRMVDLIEPNHPPQYLTREEMLYEKHYVTVPAFSCLCWQVTHQLKSPAAMRVLYEHSMTRLKQLLAENVDTSQNLLQNILLRGLTSVEALGVALDDILTHMTPTTEKMLSRFLQGVFYHFTRTGLTTSTHVLTYLSVLATRPTTSPRVAALCRETIDVNKLGPIVLVTPEYGRFSTVGGIGVMVEELARSLVALGCEVHSISPYYNFGKDGKTGYLAKEEDIKWIRNIVTYIGAEKVEVGVHSGIDQGVRHYFLHHFTYFPEPYHSGSPDYQMKALVLFAKATLELLCQIQLLPSVVITNDWFTGLVPAYVRAGLFGGTFNGTTFFHLVHNLEEAYQGRIFPAAPGDDMGYIHGLPRDFLIDPAWSLFCINASRCALLTCNNWGTVSKSYLSDLLRTSALSPLLSRFAAPFAHSNGIQVDKRIAQLSKTAKSHAEAKRMLQAKYFGEVDESIPVFSFVGRIVLQKGVHLILNAVKELMQNYQGKIQILVGGQANMKDPYASSCAWSMHSLRQQFKGSFWAAPDQFFSDGPIVNMGSDFALMPSLFEPSGVVQQEYFVAGTPVIAFKTGGLKDTVFEYNTTTNTGNGFTFEAHRHADMMQAIYRAMNIFSSPDQYEKLRKNCQESVLDMKVVAEAWAKEFARLRRCIWADTNVVQAGVVKDEQEQQQQQQQQQQPQQQPQSQQPQQQQPQSQPEVKNVIDSPSGEREREKAKLLKKEERHRTAQT